MLFCIVGALLCSAPYTPPTAYQCVAYSVIERQPQQAPMAPVYRVPGTTSPTNGTVVHRFGV